MVRREKEAMKKELKQKEKNIMNRQKTYKEQEKESRETALQSSISNENKGFALLQKMGYKAGQGLGKAGKFLVCLLKYPIFSCCCFEYLFCSLLPLQVWEGLIRFHSTSKLVCNRFTLKHIPLCCSADDS